MRNFKGFECIERKTLQSKETQTYCTKNEKVFEAKHCKNEERGWQSIFKLRSRPTELKVNQKSKYDTYECDACEVEDESQEHILQCKEISKMQEVSCENEKIENEKIMNGC